LHIRFNSHNSILDIRANNSEMYFSIKAIVFFFLKSIIILKTAQSESSQNNSIETTLLIQNSTLLIRNSTLKICSKSGFCTRIEEFCVRNDLTELKANNHSYVRIEFIAKKYNISLFKTYAYLLLNGSVSFLPLNTTDDRRTKM
jgi:hypothetical protein